MEPSEFEYDGFLVFTPIEIERRVTLDDFTDTEHSKEEKGIEPLPEFERGSPENPGRGFQQVNLFKNLQNSAVPDYIKNQLNSVKYYRHRYEKFSPSTVYVDGNFREAHICEQNTTDVVLVDPDLLLLRGTRNEVSRTISDIERIKKGLLLNRFNLSAMLLFGLQDSPESVLAGTPVKLLKINSAGFEGRKEISKLEVSIEGYDGDIREHPEFYQKGNLISLGAKFRILDQVELFVQIKQDRIHIRSSDGDMSDLTPLEQFSYALLFSKTIIERGRKIASDTRSE